MNEKKPNENEKEIYRKRIVEMVGKIEDQSILKRIYQLAEYLYIRKKRKE